MADAEEEQADLARIPGGLLINFGTLDALDGMLAAGRHANQNGKPVVFDPVGVGATAFRRATAASERDRIAV
jgi:thiamine-phosphate diphosphorylase/hydroxyethylthiazole kinase